MRNIGTPYVNIRNAFLQSASHRVSQYRSNERLGIGGVSPARSPARISDRRIKIPPPHPHSRTSYRSSILLSMNEHNTIEFNIKMTVHAVAAAYAAMSARSVAHLRRFAK